MGKLITIHHECPCRIEISHQRGRKFTQGQGLPSPWFNSYPEGEISLSYMDRLMMDFFPLFEGFLSEHKNSIKISIFQLFTHWVIIISEFTSVFIGF